MFDPETQGEFMLSFVAERHRQQLDRQALAARPPARNRWRERALMRAGDLLIDVGCALKTRGHLEISRPAGPVS
jgi:hypothetical protein